MGVKWVKIGNHDGAIDFAELLLSEGIMPIVRIFHPSPNPGVLDVHELVHLDAFIRVGVRYFEFNSEPDKDSEWKGGRVPANGLDLVVEHTIANMETILERGGMPGDSRALQRLPLGSGGQDRRHVAGAISSTGPSGRRSTTIRRIDLWIIRMISAIRKAQPIPIASITPSHRRVAAKMPGAVDRWQRSTDCAWNAANPGSTIMDDHACWLAYEYFDARNRRTPGPQHPHSFHRVRLLGGRGCRRPRYPATSPDLHMAQTLEACRVMMGTSQRFASAPDYYFCTAFWLMGNACSGQTPAPGASPTPGTATDGREVFCRL